MSTTYEQPMRPRRPPRDTSRPRDQSRPRDPIRSRPMLPSEPSRTPRSGSRPGTPRRTGSGEEAQRPRPTDPRGAPSSRPPEHRRPADVPARRPADPVPRRPSAQALERPSPPAPGRPSDLDRPNALSAQRPRRPPRPSGSPADSGRKSRPPPVPPAAEPEPDHTESTFAQGLNSLWSKFQDMTVSTASTRASADSGNADSIHASADSGNVDAAVLSKSPDSAIISDSGETDQQGMWGIWGRLKAQINIGADDVNEDDPDEVNKALRNYYATKGGPVPKFLEEQAKTTTRQDDLDRFEQRAATLGRAKPAGPSPPPVAPIKDARPAQRRPPPGGNEFSFPPRRSGDGHPPRRHAPDDTAYTSRSYHTQGRGHVPDPSFDPGHRAAAPPVRTRR